jgi:hypothetical protein
MERTGHHCGKARSIKRISLLFLLLLSNFAAPLPAQVSSSSATGLLFEFAPSISDSAWQTVRAALVRNDLSKLLGRPVLLVQGNRVSKGTEFFAVIQIAFHGDCASGRDIGSGFEKGPLGWVYFVDGRIEPFVFVDCDRIATLLQRELREEPISERQRTMACAISHVVVHELTHIVTQNPNHQGAGSLKAHVTKADLLSSESDVTVGGAAGTYVRLDRRC